MNTVLNNICAAAATLATLAAVGCTDTESATNLNPDGPPMIQQMRLRETYTLSDGIATSSRVVFGFGKHAMAREGVDISSPVNTATAMGNKFRLIVDEILIGNNLEEIACRGAVDDDAYARVPLGATPDDVARCSAAQDVLPRTCTGEFAVCLCALETGCSVPGASELIAKGAPVGVLDINQDGAADDTRFIQGAVGIQCGTIDVPLDQDMSYWNPSGNQQVPAMGGFDALGPAVVLVPQRGLPTNLDCTLTFAPEVVDKQGEQVCAPPGGDVTMDCTPGDLSAVTFKTEAMTFESASFEDGMTGVSRTDNALFLANTLLDMATIQGVTMTQGATPFTDFAVTQGMTPAMRNITVNFVPPGCPTCPATGLAPMTTYTITIPTSVQDAFGQPLPQPIEITFTTGA